MSAFLFLFFNVFLTAAARSSMLPNQWLVCPFSNHGLESRTRTNEYRCISKWKFVIAHFSGAALTAVLATNQASLYRHDFSRHYFDPG
jgi:hypothetical protein